MEVGVNSEDKVLLSNCKEYTYAKEEEEEMIDSILSIVGIAILSFSLVYGMYHVGVVMNELYSFAYGMRD